MPIAKACAMVGAVHRWQTGGRDRQFMVDGAEAGLTDAKVEVAAKAAWV